MLFKSIQSISNIKSSINTKVAGNQIGDKQSSNNTALLGVGIGINPLIGLGIFI